MATCHSRKFDYLFWGSLLIVALCFVLRWDVLNPFMERVRVLMIRMAPGMGLGLLAVIILNRIPRGKVLGLLGTRRGWVGIVRATVLGLVFDLCNHGVLVIGAQLYRRGATLGQTFAFLVATPWNSFSLLFVLVALTGIKFTLIFVAGSMVIAIVTGILTDLLVQSPKVIGQQEVSEESRPSLHEGLHEYQMIARWILLGGLLTAVIQTVVTGEWMEATLGPHLLGLVFTLGFAALIEVCSEGSAPLASDLLVRARAPGNAFAFLMGGVATDVSEMLVLKEATGRWKRALLLPLLTIPQVLILGYLINSMITVS